ncbi:hypothetical protein HZB07_03390 [Candidatus Saganbacteria bacterium]|nr:hypothetical protein [Candidatus Saganbacteria bacterium]
MTNIGQIEQVQNISEQERLDEIAGVVAAPTYLVSDSITAPEIPETDVADISEAPSSPPAAPPRLAQPPRPDNRQYVENSDEYDTAVNGRRPAGPPRRTERTGQSSQNQALDAIHDLESDVNDDVLGFDDRRYMRQNSQGYWEPDVDALFQWQQRLIMRANMLSALLIAISTRSESRQLVEEAFNGEPIKQDNSKNSPKQAYSRKIAFLMKMVRIAMGKIFEQVNTRNKTIYDRRIEEAKKRGDGFWANVENLFTGNGAQEEVERRQYYATRDYLQTTQNILAAMQRMISQLTSWLASTAGSDDLSTATTIAQLNQFSQQITQLNQKVDDRLRRANQMLENGESGYGNTAQYQENVNIEEIINRYRGSMNAAQNAQRAQLSLQLFRKDLINTVRQEMTGLSGISSNAEILMSATESTMGLAMSVFDMTASQMMLKVQLHNTAVRLLSSIQQLNEARPFRILSLVFSFVVLVASIAATIVTFGAGSPLLAMTIVAGAGLIKAGLDAAAAAVANNIQEYHAHRPEYTSSIRRAERTGNNVLDALNDIDSNQENNLADSTNVDHFLGQTTDKFYYFDSIRFAAYEARQKILDNITRSIFSLTKGARDLKRLVRAAMTGRSTTDSGESLLQNAVENIMLQRQTILSAIKFQINEVMTALNIQRQRNLRGDQAWDNFWANLGGTAGGAILGGILGGAPGAIIGAALGSSFASTVYQLIEIYSNHYFDMDIGQTAQRNLQQMIQRRSQQSVEDRLDQAEAEAYQQLLNEGMAATGDGYWGLNSGVVSAVYSRLSAIYAIKEALAKIRALSSELRAIVAQELSGLMLSRSGELSQAVISADFRQAMNLAGSITRLLSQRIQIKNRANDAEKQRVIAVVTSIINTVLFVASFVSMGLGTAFGSALLKNLPNIGAGAMNLVNTATSFIRNLWRLIHNDLGHYGNYNVKTTVDKTGQVNRHSQSVDDQLDQMKYELMLEMNQNLLTELGTGFYTVSAGTVNISTQMKRVFNMREALALARSIASALRDGVRAMMTGKRIGEVTYGKESIENYEQIAENILDALKTGLQNIAERQTQQSALVRQTILSALQTLLSVASVALSISSLTKKVEIARMRQTGASTTARSITYTQAPSQTSTSTVQANTGTNLRPQAGQVTGTPATSTPATNNQPAQTADHSADSSTSSSRTKTEMQLNEELATISKISAGVKLLNMVISIAGMFSEGVNPADRPARPSPQPADNRPNSRPEEAENSSTAGERGEMFNSLSEMENEVYDSEFIMQDIEIYEEQHAQILMRHNQLMASFISLLQDIPDFIMAFNNHKPALPYVNPDLPQQSVEARAAAAAAAAQRQAVPQVPQTPTVTRNEQAPPTSRARTEALLARAEQIERRIRETVQRTTSPQPPQTETTPPATEVRGIINNANAATVAHPQQLLEQLRIQQVSLRTEQTQIVQRLRTLNENLSVARTRVPELSSQIDQTLQQIREDQTTISREIEQLNHLPARNPEQQARLTTLNQQQSQLQLRRQALEAGQGTLAERVTEIEGQIAALQQRKTQITSELREINQAIARLERLVQQPPTTAAVVTTAASVVASLPNRLRHQSDHDRWDELRRAAEEHSREQESVGSITGGGVSC